MGRLPPMPRQHTSMVPPQSQGLLPVLLLTALAVAAAAIGFGAYLYAVPYQRLLAQSRRAPPPAAAPAAASATAGTAAPAAAPGRAADPAETRWMTEMTALKAELEQRLAASGVKVTLGPHRMRVSFPEDSIFGSRGPWLNKAGQEVMQTVVAVVANRANRMVVSAPMGAVPVAKWVRAEFPTAGDLSAARASNALKALAKAGIQVEKVYAVIATVVSAEDATGPATLDLELQPG
jgi:flagellar motor protein MotB